MALDFVKDASNYLSYGIGGLSSRINGESKYAVSALIRPDTYSATSPTNNENVVFRLMVNGTTNVLTLRVDLVAATPRVHVTARSIAADSAQTVTGTTVDLAAGSWHQIGALVDIAGDSISPVADGIIDNASAVTFGGSAVIIGTPTEPDRIGAHSATPPNIEDQFDGIIAECAIWALGSGDTGADFTSEEWLSLAEGTCPLLVRPQALAFYEPFLIKRTSPTDHISKATGTITGSLSYVDHPRILMPKRKKVYHFAPGTATYNIVLSASSISRATFQRQANLAIRTVSTSRAITTRIGQLFKSGVSTCRAAIVVQVPNITHIAISVVSTCSAALSLVKGLATRTFTGGAGLGIHLPMPRRWRRRKR